MNEYTGPEEAGILRNLVIVTIEFNKVMIPGAIGSIAVAAPYALLLIWLTNHVGRVVGETITAVFLFALLMVTMPVLAMLIIGLIFKIEQVVPWNTWGDHYAYP